MKPELKRILIVDDSPKDVELVISALSQINLASDVIVAEDGEEALDCLYKRGKFINENDYPSVILLDIKMPKMAGLDVLKHIRADSQFRMIPVIMLTSSIDKNDMIESYKIGANSYVVKPYEINKFIDAIKILGQYWAVINQPPPARI